MQKEAYRRRFTSGTPREVQGEDALIEALFAIFWQRFGPKVTVKIAVPVDNDFETWVDTSRVTLRAEVRMSARFVKKLATGDDLSWKFRDTVVQDVIQTVESKLDDAMGITLRDRYFAARRGMKLRAYIELKSRIPQLDNEYAGPAISPKRIVA